MPRLRLPGLVVLGVGVFLLDTAAAFGQVPSGPLFGAARADVDSERPALSPRSERTRGRGRSQRPTAPAYGTPPGSGAGTSGFISTNPRRIGKKSAAGKPSDPTAAAAPGAALAAAAGPLPLPLPTGPRTLRPSSQRPGASAAAPLRGPVSLPLRRTIKPDEDPFEPVGIRAGTFIVKPTVEVMGGYHSNPGQTATARGSSFISIAPELQVRSDWRVHELAANLRGSYLAYESTPSLNRPWLDARVNGRLDITRDTRADFETRFLAATDSPNSPDLPAGLARLPLYTTLGATAGLAHRFNRFEIAFKATVDRVTYEDSELTNGLRVSNQDRNYNQYAAFMRASYELTPGVKPFAEVAIDTRVRDLPVDSFGVQRDSHGTVARAGSTFEFSRKLTGELSIGYLIRSYKDPTLPDLTGLVADGSLVWFATGLTTVKLLARSTADESTIPGVAGVLRRDAGLQVDHAFRRWLVATARVGYGEDKYQGLAREDQRYLAALALTYKMSRSMYLKGELRQEWLRSNASGNNYEATIAMAGMRLQR